MVELTGSRIYIVHLSSKEGLFKVKEARDRGIDIFAETCPQYLLLDEERYKEADFSGAKYVMSPPLRTKESNEALWGGLKGGDLQVVATDHCPFDFKGKKDMFGKDDYKKIPNGAPGIETLSDAAALRGGGQGPHQPGAHGGCPVHRHRADVRSQGQGRDCGGKKYRYRHLRLPLPEIHHHPEQTPRNVHYTPFEGFEVTGMPVAVYARGKQAAVWNGDQLAFVGEVGRGRFIKREPFEGF